MRLPNGYGSVMKLKGKRRKPFAVRVTVDVFDNEKGESRQKYKYLGYFEKSAEAYTYLANYNANNPVKEHAKMVEKPSFEKVYKDWFEYKHNMNKKPSKASTNAYNYAFNMCESLHKMKFADLRVDDLQNVVNGYKGMSKSVVGNIKTIWFAMYRYAMKRELIEKDYATLVDYEWSEERRIEHCTFSIEEIKKLWDNIDIKYVDWVLILIYTGFRVSEFCELRTENINIDERYIIGGKKTDAGKNRLVPIHKDIIPLMKNIYNENQETFIVNEFGNELIYKTFKANYDEVMSTMEMNHLPHDTRYTTATLLDNAQANKICIKRIMGHSTQDVTEGVYIQKGLKELLEAIDLVKI